MLISKYKLLLTRLYTRGPNPVFFLSDSKLCSSQYSCSGPSRQNCKSLVEKYNQQADEGLEPLEIEPDVDEHQTLKHIVLLILLLCSMFVVSTPLPLV